MIEAAKEFPNVQFCHSTGTRAHTEGLANYHNAFASIYEGRYLAGIAAGMKLNEMIRTATRSTASRSPLIRPRSATLAPSPTPRLSPATPPSSWAPAPSAPPPPWK